MNKKFQLKELLLSSTIDGESEFFPLLSDEDEQKIDKEKILKSYLFSLLETQFFFRG